MEDPPSQRLDKWLWCARFTKTRTDCSALLENGQLRINRQPTLKPHARVRAGDALSFSLRGKVKIIRILLLAARRGPPQEAQRLYDDLSGDVPEIVPSESGPTIP
jgi:ribosome-associated heat shock protein Hsp15